MLIACYRLPGQPPAFRAKIADLIKKAAATMHEEIAEDAENASACNQYAWLIGNTEGDFDEALRCSQKSLELQPDEAGLPRHAGPRLFRQGRLRQCRQVSSEGRRARSPFAADPPRTRSIPQETRGNEKVGPTCRVGPAVQVPLGKRDLQSRTP